MGMSGAARWLRRNLFSSPLDAALTLLSGVLIWIAADAAVRFAVTNAAGLAANVETCRASEGACWAFISAKLDQLLFGRYPQAEQWRCIAAMLLPVSGVLSGIVARGVLGIFGVTAVTGLSIGLGFALLDGTMLGLAPVRTESWGGLTLTVMIAATGAFAALPLGILLALARQSSWPVPRLLATVFIAFWRGVPLVTVLFMAAVMLPLFLPQGVDVEKLTRALIAVALFASAYTAEVIRGGLQSIPRSQAEAAEALGFTYSQSLRLVILPQALRNALPGLTGTYIGLLKDTTLVLVIGLFDFLGMVQLAAADPDWAAPSTAITGYVFAGAVFWMLCAGLARAGAEIERRNPQRAI
jgi:general L-amino acid transport system permease protein